MFTRFCRNCGKFNNISKADVFSKNLQRILIFQNLPEKLGAQAESSDLFPPPEKRALPIEYIHAQVSREDEAGNVRQDHLNRLPVVYLDRPATPYSKSSTRFSGYQANFRETEEASGSSLSKCPLCCDIIVLLEPFSNI